MRIELAAAIPMGTARARSRLIRALRETSRLPGGGSNADTLKAPSCRGLATSCGFWSSGNLRVNGVRESDSVTFGFVDPCNFGEGQQTKRRRKTKHRGKGGTLEQPCNYQDFSFRGLVLFTGTDRDLSKLPHFSAEIPGV
jgi:hypothetical protein